MKPSVLISVVSGSLAQHILEFLRSVYEVTSLDKPEVRVVATINGDHMELGDRISEEAESFGWGERITVWRNERPSGFAANHNRVIREFEADYYLIANDDVRVRAGAIDAMVRFLEEDSAGHAVVSPQLLNPDGTLQPSTMGFPTPWRALLSASGLRVRRPVAWAIGAAGRVLPRFGGGRSRYWAHDEPKTVDTVRGAFVLVRHSAVQEVGLMTEVALVGGEETEWHRRMADHGWRVAFLPQAEVVHFGNETVSRNRELELEYLKGRLHYFEAHGSPGDLRLLRTGAIALYAGRWVAAGLARDTVGRRVASTAMRMCRQKVGAGPGSPEE